MVLARLLLPCCKVYNIRVLARLLQGNNNYVISVWDVLVVIHIIFIVMLRWFVDDEFVKSALNGELIEEVSVEC